MPVQSLDGEDPLEKRMATHSSILAWRIRWTEEPGGLQFAGLHRIGRLKWLSTHSTAQLLNRTSQVALVVKSLPAKAGDFRDAGSTPGSGRSPGGGHATPLQSSCLEDLMDRGAWRVAVHRVTESDRTERLSTHTQRN